MGSKQKVQTHSLEKNKFLLRSMRNIIINHGEWCITLLHFMLTAGRSKNYSHTFEFRQIIGPLNKHRQNKHNFGLNFKIQFFVDINNNDISCNCYVKVNKIS